MQIYPHLKATKLIPHSGASTTATITFYLKLDQPAQSNGSPKVSPIPVHIPAYTPFASSLPISDPREFISVAIRILKLYWNIHMEGLVFMVPNVLDLVWAGRSETIQLVSVGSISKPSIAISSNKHTSPVSQVKGIKQQNGRDNDGSPTPSLQDDISRMTMNDNHLASVDYRYSSPEHTGRTGNPIDTRSVILFIILSFSYFIDFSLLNLH